MHKVILAQEKNLTFSYLFSLRNAYAEIFRSIPLIYKIIGG